MTDPRLPATLIALEALEARALLLLAATVFGVNPGTALAAAEQLHREVGVRYPDACDRIRRDLAARAAGPAGACPCCAGLDQGDLLELCGPCWSNYVYGLSESCVHEPHRRPPYAFFRNRRNGWQR